MPEVNTVIQWVLILALITIFLGLVLTMLKFVQYILGRKYNGN